MPGASVAVAAPDVTVMGGRQGDLDGPVRDAYERLRRPVLRRARRWFPSLAEADLEDVYQAAWLSFVRTDAEVRDIEDYLYAAVHSQGLMELRRRRRRPITPLLTVDKRDSGESQEPRGVSQDEVADMTAALPEERAETSVMAAWARDLLAELSSRQAAAVKLRWGWGLSRHEVAGLLGVSVKAVKRDLEAAGRRLSADAEELEGGRWCERKRSLVTAYALDLLSPARAARAEAHLHACASCRGLVRELRRRAEDVAALAPAPSLVGYSTDGPWEAVGVVFEKARVQLSELTAGAKQQAVSLSVRVTDPTPLAGARPGAVGALVAGCLAAGTGAYCAVQGTVPEPLRVGPLAQERPPAQKLDQERARPVASQADPAPPVAVAPQPVADVPPVEPTRVETGASSAVPTPSPEQKSAAEPSQEFFGSEPSAPAVAGAAGAQPAQAAPAPAAPTSSGSMSSAEPAPAEPRGEFGGP